MTFGSAFALAFSLAACAPALNWRSVRPEGAAVEAMFPCRPARHERDVALAGSPVRMTMLACTAGDATFALAFADMGDPVRAARALASLREAAVANLQGVVERDSALSVGPTKPGVPGRRVSIIGQLPSGKPARLVAVFVAHGAFVYQATVFGEALDDQAVEPFVTALRVSQ